MQNVILSVLIGMVLISGCQSQTGTTTKHPIAIIPAPVSFTQMKGSYSFTDRSRIIVSPLNTETRVVADFLAHMISNSSGMDISVTDGSGDARASVYMSLDSSVKNAEGYYIKIDRRSVTVRAATPAGLFYAVQTIRQLFPPEVEAGHVIKGMELVLPACEIIDEPAFVYRGMHLDVARHMFSVEEIKKYIDILALHKMNTFHWHLTDDQGWRLEIRKYPELTRIGSFRKETLVGHSKQKPNIFDGVPYGGYYTQDEVRDIVDYASSRFITIIPEIEMPGHSLAILACHPELACTDGPFEVATTWGVFHDVLCAGKEETFVFLQDVLSEVADLFPGKYIHIGGDECPKTRWEQCPLCRQRIREEKLADEHELQSYFIRRMEKHLFSIGKEIIGWDEILEGGLAPGATVMSWRGTEGGIAAARQKHRVIMTPNNFVYLDYYQCEPEGQPLSIGGYLPLEKVYSFNPVPAELSTDEQKYITGVQGNVWTEYISVPEHLEYMVFPRAFAIAETGWTPARLKNFEDFLVRLGTLTNRYDIMGINYFRGEYRDTRKP